MNDFGNDMKNSNMERRKEKENLYFSQYFLLFTFQRNISPEETEEFVIHKTKLLLSDSTRGKK